MLFLSVVSGTSTDGLSVSVVDIEECGYDTKVRVISHKEVPFPPDLRKELITISSMEPVNSELLSMTHWKLGRFIATVASSVKEDFDAVVFSGYTIYHGPSLGKKEYGTYQIGEISEVVAKSGKTAVYDFRTSDISYGGLGAPLVALSDKYLFKDRKTLTLNIGGIANVTYVGGEEVLAFDTGPGNILIDDLSWRFYRRSYDEDSRFASSGEINQDLLENLLQNPYLSIRPPKTTGREYFGKTFVDNLLKLSKSLSKEDIMRTVTRFTSESIVDQIRRFIPADVGQIIVGGGGTRNPLIMNDLAKLLPGKIRRFSDFGIDDKAREGVGFAVIANETIRMHSGRVISPHPGDSVLGKIAPGKNYFEILRKTGIICR